MLKVKMILINKWQLLLKVLYLEATLTFLRFSAKHCISTTISHMSHILNSATQKCLNTKQTTHFEKWHKTKKERKKERKKESSPSVSKVLNSLTLLLLKFKIQQVPLPFAQSWKHSPYHKYSFIFSLPLLFIFVFVSLMFLSFCFFLA